MNSLWVFWEYTFALTLVCRVLYGEGSIQCFWYQPHDCLHFEVNIVCFVFLITEIYDVHNFRLYISYFEVTWYFHKLKHELNLWDKTKLYAFQKHVLFQPKFICFIFLMIRMILIFYFLFLLKRNHIIYHHFTISSFQWYTKKRFELIIGL